MKIKCQKKELLDAINIVGKAVPTRTSMPILQCILIDASKDYIKLVANDTELGIETILDGEILENGIVALDANMFGSIVGTLDDDVVYITVDQDLKTNIKCARFNNDISGKSGEDFSYIPYVQRNNPILLSQFTLKDIITQTIFSVSDNEDNKILGGELFEVNGKNFKVTSLDGHRVSIRTVELKEENESVRVIVPGSSLKKISNILKTTDDVVAIYTTPNHIIFEFNNTTVVSRLIDGEYFDTSSLFMSDYDVKFTVNRKDLMDAIKRTTPFIEEKDRRPIVMDIVDNNINLSINASKGYTEENIDINKEGSDIRIGFNHKFFIDALNVIDDEEIKIYMTKTFGPCFIKDDLEKYIYIILPININN